jgi:toxin-antitoxin system PIN domain toxin
MKSYFPDVNVWLALVYEGHEHHPIAQHWFEELQDQRLYFSRFTQLGFLRLLTHASVMRSDVKNSRQAWLVYDALLEDARISFSNEPGSGELAALFRKLSTTSEIFPQRWADTYLTAFAQASEFELVTFDRALANLSRPAATLLY